MAVGDLWKLIDVQNLAGQQVLNVYFYEEVTSPTLLSPPLALIQAFRDSVVAPLALIQATELIHINYLVENTDNPAEFGSLAASSTGAVSAESLPPFCAWAFRLNRTTRVIRNGQKRFAGVPESLQDNGTITAAGLALAIPVADALSQNIEQTVPDGTWSPRIVHRNATIPVTYTAYAFGLAQYVSLSTQNTRKIGRGA